MKLWSNSFENKKAIDAKFSKDGGNVSPHLAWSDLPEGTKALAILVHDPDAPTQSGFWHWQLINIPVDTTEIAEGASGLLPPAIIEKNNDADMPGWYGPQPPQGHGVHNYNVTLVALKDTITTTVEQSRAYTSFMIWANTIDSVQISFTYEVK